MGAAIEGPVGLYTVPNDLAAAVLAGRGKSSDGAFKAVEHMRPTSHEHLKGLIVLVAAHFTLCHAHNPLSLKRLACAFTFTLIIRQGRVKSFHVRRIQVSSDFMPKEDGKKPGPSFPRAPGPMLGMF